VKIIAFQTLQQGRGPYFNSGMFDAGARRDWTNA
jgi:hypothetical protein